METTDYKKIKEAVFKVFISTGNELMKHYGNVETEISKDGAYTSGIVTKLDRETEEKIKEFLQKEFPHIGFRGEEMGDLNSNNKDELTWLVDPIDGTAHFVRGLPFCTTMIALIKNGEAVFSAIHDFTQKDIYWAVKNEGAYKNNERISVIERPAGSSFISFETNINKGNQNLHKEVGNRLGALVATINCGFEFSRIASGKLDGKLTKDPYGMDWDFAPGCLLVEEAGGVVRNHGSKKYYYKNHDFFAGTRSVYEEVNGLFNED